MICKHCGYDNPEGETHCINCGAKLTGLFSSIDFDKFNMEKRSTSDDDNNQIQDPSLDDVQNPNAEYEDGMTPEKKKKILTSLAIFLSITIFSSLIVLATKDDKPKTEPPGEDQIMAQADEDEESNEYETQDQDDYVPYEPDLEGEAVNPMTEPKGSGAPKSEKKTPPKPEQKQASQAPKPKEQPQPTQSSSASEYVDLYPTVYSDTIFHISDNDITFDNVTADSFLSQRDIVHYPERIADGDLSTAWSEGVSGPGIGQKIYLDCDYDQPVDSISIWNGYQKSESLFYANNRPSSILLKFNNHPVIYRLNLKDWNQQQSFRLPEKLYIRSVTLEIEDVYKGNKYDDTCITEVQFSELQYSEDDVTEIYFY